MLQIRYPDGRSYNPARDITNLFPNQICSVATMRLAKFAWHPAIQEYAAQTGCTEQDLSAAAACLAEFINLATRLGSEKFDRVWHDAGFPKLKPAALMCLFFQVGLSTAGVYHFFVRMATKAGRVPHGVDTASALIDESADALLETNERRRKIRADEVAGKHEPEVN